MVLYNNSIPKALQAIFPDHNWSFTKRPVKLETDRNNIGQFFADLNLTSATASFWKSTENVRNLFNWMGIQLGHKQMEDWYKTSSADIRKLGASGVIHRYGNSCAKALQTVYPEHNWMGWKFVLTPKGYWKSVDVQKDFFTWLGIQLGHKDIKDWYRVTPEDVRVHGGGGLLIEYNASLCAALQSIFPEHHWDNKRFAKYVQRVH